MSEVKELPKRRKSRSVTIARGGVHAKTIAAKPVGNVVVAKTLPSKIKTLNLKRADAVALKKGLDFLNSADTTAIVESCEVHKANVSGKNVFSLRTSDSMRVMFGIDAESGKVLVYDVVDRKKND